MDVGVDHESFEYDVGRGPRGLRHLRREFAAWLVERVDDRRMRNDLVLAASEMSAAASRVDGTGLAEVRVTSWTDGDAIVIEVHDGAGDLLDGAVHGLRGAADAHRGLSVVASVTDVLTVKARGATVALRARRGGVAHRRGFAADPTGY